MIFPELEVADLCNVTNSIDDDAYSVANEIVDAVMQKGEPAIRRFAKQLDGWSDGQALLLDRSELENACERVESKTLKLLQRVHERIQSFALAQKDCVKDLENKIAGGTAGHRWLPLKTAGCYAPGGRYPLPSSVLMTAATAKVAGVDSVWVSSPRPDDVTLASAAIGGADGFLCVGGAQAIAAMASGFAGLPACETIVGPGNQYVTAAKAIVSRFVRIDSLAGPSELVIVADSTAHPKLIAADLLAQAEHDDSARPILISLNRELVNRVNIELERQLEVLPTSAIAKNALQNGGYVLANDIEQAVEFSRLLAPEHLSIQGDYVEEYHLKFDGGAALFVGSNSAEVFGDYGAGPNHVLPTCGNANSHSALSVLNFMRFQTVLRIDDLESASSIVADATQMGRLEGLEGHARSSELRLS